MKKVSIWILIASVVITALVISGGFLLLVRPLGETGEESEAKRKIRIGGTISVSGKASGAAGPFGRLYNAWEKLINKRGGLYVEEYGRNLPVEFVWYDDKSSKTRIERLYTKLIEDDNVDLLLGPYGSVNYFPLLDKVKKQKVPMIATTDGAPDLYKEGIEGFFGPIDFVTHWSDRYFELVDEVGRANSIAFIVSDQSWARAVHAGAKEKAKEIGLEIVHSEITSPETSNFSPVISKLKKKNPDIVYVDGWVDFCSNFTKQALAQELKPKEYHITQLIKTFLESVGEEKAEYMTGEWYWMEGVTYDGIFGRDVWIEAMEDAEIKNKNYPWAAVHWYALETAAAGIEQSESLSYEDLTQSLNNLDIQTISGPLRFRDFGNFTNIGTIVPTTVQLQNGEYEIMMPQEQRTAEYVYPTPE